MTFKKGDEWLKSGGNPNGRPPDFRMEETKNFVKKNWGRVQSIVDRLCGHAEQDKQWAIKMVISHVLPYFLGKPKSEIEITENKDMNGLVETFTNLSDDQANAIYDIVRKKTKDE
ncbi:MAG: hypothetical protein ACTHJ2_09445 [Candidatus Nitrosocosmicus sp.]